MEARCCWQYSDGKVFGEQCVSTQASPVYPRLWTLGEFSEGQLAQVQVLLRVKNPTLQQLLPATTTGRVLQQTHRARRTKGEEAV